MNLTYTKDNILFCFATAGAFIAEACGGWDPPMRTLIAVMIADYITGLIVAAFFKKSNKSASGALDSRAGFAGLLKKAVILLIVVIAFNLDSMAGTDKLIRTAVILFYIGNEGISIIENVGLMGIPVNTKLREAFEVLRNKGDSKDDTKTN